MRSSSCLRCGKCLIAKVIEIKFRYPFNFRSFARILIKIGKKEFQLHMLPSLLKALIRKLCFQSRI